MNKTLIALAVAGAFALPLPDAQAQGSVTIYGTLNVNFENFESDGASPAGPIPGNSFVTGTGVNVSNRNQVTSNSSALGFKGQEDLGGGWKAWFQLENDVRPDGSTAGAFAGRNSAVGLSSPWGTVFLGNWDTPYKAMTTGFGMPFFSTTTAAYNAIIGSPGFGVRSGTTAGAGSLNCNAGFDRRQNNSVQYWSPEFMGVRFRAVYGENDSEPASGNTSPAVWGGSLAWEGMGIQLGVAYERHEDLFGTRAIDGGSLAAPAVPGADSKDTGLKLQAAYKIQGKYLVGVLWERLEYETSVAGANLLTEYERDAWGVYAILPVGPGAIHFNYISADDGECRLKSGAPCAGGGTDAEMWAIGYYYNFSKRTQLYVQYVDMDNGDAQFYRLGVGPAEVGVGGPGADPQAFALGIRHSF